MISELGGYAVSAITSITVQNTLGIQEFYDIPSDIVSGQIEAVINDMEPEIVKIGMIRNVKVLLVIINAIKKYSPRAIIYDPIVCSAVGEQLMKKDIIMQIIHKLLPVCTLIIIKKQDVEYIMQQKIESHYDEMMAVESLKAAGCQEVLLLEDESYHGLGNHLSSAIAYYLSNGIALHDAITQGKAYIKHKIVRGTEQRGRGGKLFNEFVNLVSAHVRTNSDVAFYADRLNVSGRYLAQVTKRISSKAPKIIIDEYLIHEIETELLATEKTIQEIAYDFKFSSQAHFTKFFKKMKACSPSIYRKNKII